MNAALIAVDWGTTTARAYLMSASGEMLDQRTAPLGIVKIRDGRFAEALQTLLGNWSNLPVPRLACGMIGSRQGWCEAPYVSCPASFADLSRGLVSAGNGALQIVPGLITRNARNVPDVLRGEETQLFGAVGPHESVIAVLPGTHSKWAKVERGVIVDFRTFMTGELYAVLLEHSILGRMADRTAAGEELSNAFDRGVAHGLADCSLPHDLFAARTLALTGEIKGQEVAPWLSGLLIGCEIRDGRRMFPGTESVRLIGEDELCRRYEQALALAGMKSERGPSDAAAKGLWRIGAG
jgi:2-dehydro-3-deoxygalactonokinase